jgi:hypothetical protein
MNINLGFSYVPGTIRASLNGVEIPVEETNPYEGRILAHVPRGYSGEISIDYQRRLLQSNRTKRTEVIGSSSACIYCGSTEDLTDEHVIPYALEGDFVIRSASCKQCAAKTSRFERAVLRDALLAPRTALNLRTRRPSERPTSLPLLKRSGETTSVVDVPVSEHPTYLALPIFDLPAHLRGDSSPNLKVVTPGVVSISVSAATMQMAAEKFGENAGVQVTLDIYAFARMLAKIAHGFAAAADLGDVESFLVGPMFADDESIGEWVGGAPDVTLGTEGLHAVNVRVIDGQVQVRIRLFAQLGGPEYLVVVGRLLDGPLGNPFATVEPNKRSGN